jgi:hypothetical protein
MGIVPGFVLAILMAEQVTSLENERFDFQPQKLQGMANECREGYFQWITDEVSINLKFNTWMVMCYTKETFKAIIRLVA